MFHWDVNQGTIDPKAIEFAEVIVHLAGAGIADKRWTKKRKKELVDSRVKSTELIVNQLKAAGKGIEAVVAASAIGYYGALTTSHVFTEKDLPANDFLGRTTQQWESATSKFRELGILTIQIRLGVVLAAEGGALNKMALPVKFGLGSPIGSGKQLVPWIHIHDLCTLFMMAIEQSIPDGIYNAVAPAQNTNSELIKTIARVLHRPCFFPAVPGLLLRFSMGEMANMVLEGSAVSAQKIIDAGFQFSFTELDAALEDLIGSR